MTCTLLQLTCAQSPGRVDVPVTLLCVTSACVSVCSNSLSLLSGAPLAHLRTRSTASLTCLEQQIQRGGTVQSVGLSSSRRVKALIAHRTRALLGLLPVL